jgi:predicted permease
MAMRPDGVALVVCQVSPITMRALRKFRLLVRSLVESSRVDAELDEELRYHLDRQVESHRAAGLSPDEARAAALRDFGGLEQRKEECRDARGVTFVASVMQDARYAVRALSRAPGFTAVALFSLALGIGANTTIFTFVNAVLLTPLPYPHAERIVTLREQPLGAADTVAVHPQNFLEWGARSRSFDALALVQTIPMNVVGAAGAEQVNEAQTTPAFFRVFGLDVALGRAFSGADVHRGSERVAILGHGFWQRRFGGSPAALGQRLAASDGSLTIVGVAMPGIRIGPAEPDIYTPLAIDPTNPASIGSRSFQCYGRLKPGTSLEAVRSEMNVIASQLAREYALDDGYGVAVFDLHGYLVREGRPALRLLMAVVATVLVIACANLAVLLMARGVGRRGELAVRASLGASRARLVRQLVIESLVLAAIGGAAGLFLASWTTRALVSLTEGALTIGTTEPIRLDSTCLAFTIALSTITALFFGLVPAWQASRVEPGSALGRQTRGGTADRRQHRVQRALVIGEVSLAVVLLVGAGLLLRTFSTLVRVDVGFEPSETITMRLFLGDREPALRVALLDRILDRVGTLPGVKAASSIQFLPLSGMTCGTGVWLEDRTPTKSAEERATDCSLVSRGYFAAMGIPLVQGRDFDRHDTATTPHVAIVNHAFAKQYLPGGALGRRIRVHSTDQPPAEIIAVVGNIRHSGLTSDPAPNVFLLHAQSPGYITNLVVRTTGDPAAQATAIRSAIQDVDPTQAVAGVKTMAQYVGDLLARPRLYAAMVASFAALAVLLAVIGVYGLLAYVAGQRVHEFGIRMALGAGRGEVFRDVFTQGAVLTIAGLIVGISLAVALRRLVSTLLFGVTATDPSTYVAAATLLAALAIVVIAVPAWRASRVDPTTALRYE